MVCGRRRRGEGGVCDERMEINERRRENREGGKTTGGNIREKRLFEKRDFSRLEKRCEAGRAAGWGRTGRQAVAGAGRPRTSGEKDVLS